MEVNAFVLHQLVRALRSGAIEKTAFPRVVLVGHGLGSITAGEHPPGCGRRGADRHQSFLTERCIVTFAHSANQDPQFARRSLDDDYLTTAPGSREVSFRSALMTQPDPRLMALDEAVKETVTTAELRTASAVLTSGASSAIRVPVLMMAGQFDPGVCGGASICASPEASAAAFAVAEARFFAADACLETAVDLWHAKHSKAT